jgi:selenocysteine-specific elongation factor
MDVVCTAGHVDHGKSTLVRALTGMEPDRFDEERRRGLTIDLGFAWAELSAGGRARTVAFVDLPGHQRFIANMLAGAGPAEVALFVVAADEGWKPQSQEHLEILDVLGIASGVVCVTKVDAVTPTRVEEVTSDLRTRLATSSLADAPVVAVSAQTGDGLDELRSALLDVLEQRHSMISTGPPRLWVDRVFTVKGAGTVVTGTLTGGRLHVGDAVELRPGAHRGRVRGLQSLEQVVPTAAAGDRVAVNITGAGVGQITRGQVLTTSEAAPATPAIDVWLRTVGDRVAGRRGAWHVHAGSGRWTGRLRPYGAAQVQDEGFARIALDAEAPLQPGDGFVLREAGSRTTVGGGIVLDTDPPQVRGAAARARRVAALQERLSALRRNDRAALLALAVREHGVLAAAEAAGRAGLPVAAVPEAARAHGLLPLGNGFADAAAAARWGGAVAEALREYHGTHPLERAAPRDVALTAATAAGCPPSYVAPLLVVLGQMQRIVAEGTGLRLPDHGVALSPADQQAKDRLLSALNRTPFAPPGLHEAATAAGASPALLRELEVAGDLVRLGPDLVMTSAAVRQAATELQGLYARTGPLTAAQAKQAWGTSRKFALPLLEELDRRGITRRNGDVRDVIIPNPLPPSDR